MAALSMGVLAYQTASQFTAQRRQAGAAIAQGNYTAGVDNQNATLADAQAADAVARGSQQAGASVAQTRQALGAARATAGAQGVSANAGSSLDLQAETARTGALDASTIRANAAREAWGFTAQGVNDRQQGMLAQRAGQNDAAALRAQSWGTLLTGVAQGFGQYKANQRNATPGSGGSGGGMTPSTRYSGYGSTGTVG